MKISTSLTLQLFVECKSCREKKEFCPFISVDRFSGLNRLYRSEFWIFSPESYSIDQESSKKEITYFICRPGLEFSCLWSLGYVYTTATNIYMIESSKLHPSVSSKYSSVFKDASLTASIFESMFNSNSCTR